MMFPVMLVPSGASCLQRLVVLFHSLDPLHFLFACVLRRHHAYGCFHMHGQHYRGGAQVHHIFVRPLGPCEEQELRHVQVRFVLLEESEHEHVVCLDSGLFCLVPGSAELLATVSYCLAAYVLSHSVPGCTEDCGPELL